MIVKKQCQICEEYIEIDAEDCKSDMIICNDCMEDDSDTAKDRLLEGISDALHATGEQNG